MRISIVFIAFLILSSSFPATALEQRGALVLNKEPLYEFESPRKLACTELYDVRAGRNVPDMREFRNYFCEGRYTATLRGKAGRTVTLFGSFNYGKRGGFVVIEKKDDRTIWVDAIEDIPSGRWVDIKGSGNYGAYRAFYHAAPQFSQSISSIKWGKWWRGKIPSP